MALLRLDFALDMLDGGVGRGVRRILSQISHCSELEFWTGCRPLRELMVHSFRFYNSLTNWVSVTEVREELRAVKKTIMCYENMAVAVRVIG